MRLHGNPATHTKEYLSIFEALSLFGLVLLAAAVGRVRRRLVPRAVLPGRATAIPTTTLISLSHTTSVFLSRLPFGGLSAVNRVVSVSSPRGVSLSPLAPLNGLHPRNDYVVSARLHSNYTTTYVVPTEMDSLTIKMYIERENVSVNDRPLNMWINHSYPHIHKYTFVHTHSYSHTFTHFQTSTGAR